MRAGKFRLNQSSDHVHGGPLRREDQVDAHSARHLRQSGDRFFHVVGVHHHQVGQLVDHNDQVWKRFVLGLFQTVEQRRRVFLLERAVVLVDVSHAALRQ